MLQGRAFDEFVHPRQFPRAILAALFAVPFVLLLGLVPFALLAGPLYYQYGYYGTYGFSPRLIVVPVLLVLIVLLPIVFLIWIGARVAFAYILGNSVLVSASNYPRIHRLVAEVTDDMDYRKNIHVFVYQQGDFNATMRRFFWRRAIFLNSEIVAQGVTDDEIRWITGRFIGYWRARRRSGPVGLIIRIAERFLIFNFFILPYERAMVYTGDRVALASIGGDIGTAVSAMQKLLVGRELGYSINPAGIVEQHRRVKGSLFAFLARLPSFFPHTTARFVDLIAFSKWKFPEQYARFVAENPSLPGDYRGLKS